MKLKKIIITLLFLTLPIIIYTTNVDRKIYYLSLGDSLAAGQNAYGNIGYGYSDYVSDYLVKNQLLEFYTKKYAAEGYRTTDLIRDIEDNKKIIINNKEITLKNALTNADIVTLSIGANDLLYKLSITTIDSLIDNEQELKEYVKEVIEDIERLLYLLKRYCKEDVIIIGYYNPLWQKNIDYANQIEPIILYANSQLKQLSIKNDIYYIDIYEGFKNNKDLLPNPLDIHPSNRGYKFISDKIITVIEKNILN